MLVLNSDDIEAVFQTLSSRLLIGASPDGLDDLYIAADRARRGTR